MDVRLHSDWKNLLKDEFDLPYFEELVRFVKHEYRTQQCFPPGPLIFNAFEACRVEHTRVVILGQDPYIRPGQAHGLSFSVPDGVAFPPSLQNILKEVERDVGVSIPPSGNLERWAQQGVLLLNTTLTVREGASGSHQGRGWETFTDAVIRAVDNVTEGGVFMLWGSHAIKKVSLIDSNKHLILTAPHPSPLSAYRGFHGCAHFSAANVWLTQRGRPPVHW